MQRKLFKWGCEKERTEEKWRGNESKLKVKANTPQQLSWVQSKPAGWSFFSHHHRSDCLLLCSYPAGHHLEYVHFVQYIQHESFYGIIGSVLSVLYYSSTPCDWGVWHCLIRVRALSFEKLLSKREKEWVHYLNWTPTVEGRKSLELKQLTRDHVSASALRTQTQVIFWSFCKWWWWWGVHQRGH